MPAIGDAGLQQGRPQGPCGIQIGVGYRERLGAARGWSSATVPSAQTLERAGRAVEPVAHVRVAPRPAP